MDLLSGNSNVSKTSNSLNLSWLRIADILRKTLTILLACVYSYCVVTALKSASVLLTPLLISGGIILLLLLRTHLFKSHNS